MKLDLLDHLLTLATPQDAAELLQRLDRDLGNAVSEIDRAVATGDQTSVSATLHVLIGITGSVGAAQVFALAKALGQDAKDEKRLSPRLLDQLKDGIASLRAEARRRSQAGGASP